MKLLRKGKNFAKKLLNIVKKPAVSYKGFFPSFEAAENLVKNTYGGGYSSLRIFEKVKNSTLAVVENKAVFERDSFLFYKKEVNYNLMYYLYQIYFREGKLNMLDFGGALGSTYFQHKEELDRLSADWTVTEQRHFVDFGKEKLETANLHFVQSDEISDKRKFNVALFSSCLQYIKNYKSIVSEYCKSGIENIIIERTPVSDCQWYWVETVHEPIYEAVYTGTVFFEEDFTKLFTDFGYELVDSWKSLVDCDVQNGGHTAHFKSFVFRLKK